MTHLDINHEVINYQFWKIKQLTWQKMQAPFLFPSMVEALMINSISGTSVSAILANF